MNDMSFIKEADLNLADGEFAVVHAAWFKTYYNLYSEGNRQSILRGQKHDVATLEKYRFVRIDLRQRIMATMKDHGIAAKIKDLSDAGDLISMDRIACVYNAKYANIR